MPAMADIPGEAWTAGGAVIVALIGFATAFVQRRRRKQQEHIADNAVKELRFQAAALTFDQLMTEWNEIYKDLVALFEETHIERFLLFRCWNGAMEPLWTTAFFQVRAGDHRPINYVHFELDEDYRDRIVEVVRHGAITFEIADMPDCALKDVYLAEEVKHSALFFVDKMSLKGTNSSSITYCSFATHHDKPIDDALKTRMRLIVNRMKGVAIPLNETAMTINQ